MAATRPSPLPMPLASLAAASRPLLGLSAVALLLFATAAVGLLLDPRTITGAPAWLKPLKFAVSVGIYAVSLLWLCQKIEGWPRLVRAITTATTATLTLELALIFLQAARGRASHFNLSTTFDLIVFQVMGLAILVFWIFQIATAVLVLRHPFADPVLAWSLRFGLVIAVLGAAVGWIMTTPRPDQLDAIRHGVLGMSGAHTIGAADGTPGLPLVNWSREHGDLRAAHFFGLHALQLLPLAGWVIGRQTSLNQPQRVGLIWTVSGSFFGLFVILLWQALRGQALLSPDGTTRAALLVWLAASGLAAVLTLLLARDQHTSNTTVVR